MSKILFEKRKKEFIEFINKEKKLPKTGEIRFSDGEDMRIWFDKLIKIAQYKGFLSEINEILDKYNKKILTDEEKEKEFLNFVNKIKRIPMRGEMFFIDNADMHTWYMNYKKKNKNFETLVYTNLPEYLEFDLAPVWTLIKQEFINILKMLKRIPEHGEVFLHNNIDVRVVYEKLKTYDPEFFEKLLLHLKTYDKKGLTLDNYIEQLKATVSVLGYIPQLQEARFTNGTDMFTWYTVKKEQLPNLEIEVNALIKKDAPEQNVHIYLIPNFRNKGGKFYTICTNVGEQLDLSNITSYEEAQKIYPTLVKRGGLILKKDEQISSISFGKGKKN